MKTIETNIHINAAPETVWAILMDADNYPKWNPLIQQLRGSIIKGERLEATLQVGERKPMVFKPTVLVKDENAEFRWLGHLFVKGLFDGEHYFRLEPTLAGGTNFIHGEKFTGILSGTLFKMIGEESKEGFIAMNEALKQQAEQIQQQKNAS